MSRDRSKALLVAETRATGFDADAQAKVQQQVRALFESADRQLAGKQWLAGFRSYADPYLYITLRWADGVGIDLSGLEHLAAFKARMEADPAVRKALAIEGLA